MSKTKDTIITLAQQKGQFTSHDVLAVLNRKLSRQAVAHALRRLVATGVLIKIGHTRGATYARAGTVVSGKITKHLRNHDLEEHVILQDIKTQAHFLDTLPDHVASIFAYAFDEMMNNAIEHSQSKAIDIQVWQDDGKKTVNFSIKDTGIGVFRNVMNIRRLPNELAAIQDILKGKTTTAPKAHSGEGIFFTSKVVDLFVLTSFGLKLRVDNELPDTFVEQMTPVRKGTLVTGAIYLDTKRHISDVFQKFQSNDDTFAFDKTEVLVRLYTMETIYISRSQARRLVSGLEKFKKIVLDFTRVPTVGQAFADEIFRVFHKRHPKIDLVTINMNEAVRFMVERACAPV